ncbi:1,4-alpha-glucan branching protein GlgB [Gloeobacter morelensis]|uniref:1,4-alpha-glucan branching enzyme GlgB n=1 Tax=Gloeobacter morelensis MG652769 TaxID=2781736 RepID=A0ABY3PJS4_9CYAN|nr:1,4-alpha-glucan branching protein GlgB [Gloeobacter morelensis]UFP93906.1 1,4-alpha-glucan branching protein GlgB [Gloeobacter morelensis MG652769]
MNPTVELRAIEALVTNLHADPFAILGPHRVEDGGGWVVRTYQPGASRVVLLGESGEVAMENYRHPDLFECAVPTDPGAYRLRVEDAWGERLIEDAYRFRGSLLSDLDSHLFAEGNHHRIYEKLGAHPAVFEGVAGVYFSVWAPGARNVSVLGDFNRWDGRFHQMRRVEHSTGIWELFIPELGEGTVYKFEIKNGFGHIYEKSDPYAFEQELRPKSGSVVADLDRYRWNDGEWLKRRALSNPLKQPLAIYEVHLGSWMRVPEEGNRFLSYTELADRLIPYIKDLGFTHIELLPILEHPFDGSWGYQVLSYYAPTSRFGTPQEFMAFVDRCHRSGIGVILDWVPAHFPKDGHGLALFDGTHLYEHADPRQGEHKEWGTLVFNYGRNEVRNFLIANALFWFERYHIDGIRVDAVAAMLYLDYSRKNGEWVANRYGGRENLEAIGFLRQLNELIFLYYPGALSIAEESTAWPLVTRPPYLGGLGFNLKWHMGWMHDTLAYFRTDPLFRRYRHNDITFSITYTFYENFVLALSHDEVVHMKGSIIGKMPGDGWQKFANLRALFTFMYGHPGKKTLFMGMEFAQGREWNAHQSLDWHLLDHSQHRQIQQFFRDLNRLYAGEPALYEEDCNPAGFFWIDCNDVLNSVFTFVRRGKDPNEQLLFVCNFTPAYHSHYRVGVPEAGFWQEIFNSDSGLYGGSNKGNLGGLWSENWGVHGQPHSLGLQLPPLGCLVLKRRQEQGS